MLNEFIPCSNNICDILKHFRSSKIPAIPLIWPKSPHKHSVTWSYRSGKESGRRSESPLWRHQWRSFVFISHADDIKREIRLYISRLLTNQKHWAWDKYIYTRADSRFASSQWETALLCKNISHWLGTNLESPLHIRTHFIWYQDICIYYVLCWKIYSTWSSLVITSRWFMTRH